MKFIVHTYGCQMNVRDSEALEALMLAAGHEKAASEDEADVVVVNSCTVRQKAEEKAIGKAGNMIAAKKITGMMGCAVKRMGEDVFKRLPKLDQQEFLVFTHVQTVAVPSVHHFHTTAIAWNCLQWNRCSKDLYIPHSCSSGDPVFGGQLPVSYFSFRRQILLHLVPAVIRGFPGGIGSFPSLTPAAGFVFGRRLDDQPWTDERRRAS